MSLFVPLDQIRDFLDRRQLIAEIEAGFAAYSAGEVTVPPVGFLHFDDPTGDVHIKYGAIDGDDCYVLKMASAFPANLDAGLPATDGLMLVFDQRTGSLRRILHDQGWLTDQRTAAAGAVAAKHLANPHIHRIGIVGTGVQARLQLEFLREVTDCRQCLVWGRDVSKAERLVEELGAQRRFEEWGLRMEPAPCLDDLVRNCDLIVTTTSSTEPLIRAEMVRPGTHITAMGSDDHGKQELQAEILAQADLVVADSVAQCTDHGECRAAVEGGVLERTSIRELGSVICNPKTGRTSEEQITVADLTGVAIQDIQIAKMVDRALSAQLSEDSAP